MIAAVFFEYRLFMKKNHFLFLFLFLFTSAQGFARIQPIFNEPGFGTTGIETLDIKLISLINSTPKDASIHMTLYGLDRIVFSEALLAAKARGVNVNVIFDHKMKKFRNTTGHAVNLISQNGRNKWVQFSPKISVRRLHINHNKFFLFSRLNDGSKNVVVSSSGNVTEMSLKEHNDMLVIDGDKKLYDGFLKLWKNLLKKSFALSRPSIYGNGIKFNVFPQYFKDPILALLKRVSCLPGSSIRIAQSRFGDSRVQIAKRLDQLRSEGCEIQVVLRDEKSVKSPGKKVLPILSDDVIVLPYERINKVRASIHSKLFLIDALIDDEPAKLVLTGSHNLNETSLFFNDEVLAELQNEETFELYDKFWDRMIKSMKESGILDL